MLLVGVWVLQVTGECEMWFQDPLLVLYRHPMGPSDPPFRSPEGVMGITTFHVQMDMYSTLIRATVARMDVDTCMELWVSDMDRLDHVWSH